MRLHTLTPEEFDFFREFLDALPIQCFVKDAQGNVLLMNQACEEALGVSFSDVRGAKIKQFFPAEQVARFEAKDQEVFALGHALGYEEVFWSAKYGQNRIGYIVKNPVFDPQGRPLFLIGSTLDISEQKQLQQQVDHELEMLKLLVADAPLTDVLTSFVKNFEATFPDLICSILLLDDAGTRLHLGAAPSLPAAYCQAINGVEIGPSVGSCGTAAYREQDTIVADIATDPLWENYAALALSHHLRSCWSIPIFSSKGKVLGTFANYRSTPSSPQPYELQAVKRGAYLAGLAIEHDLTERQLAAERLALRDSALHTKTILDHMGDGVITLNAQGLIEIFNLAASQIFGYAPDEVIGRNVSVLMPEPHATLHDGYLQHYQATGKTHVLGAPRELEGRRKDGSVFPMRLSVSEIVRGGHVTFIGLLSDITHDQQRIQEIHRLAFYDPLTSLPNRRLLMDRLQKTMSASARSGHHGAIMFLDLDHFKQLNDMHGHDVGDALLQQVASRLLGCIRESDSVARFGGDEFVILLDALSVYEPEAASQAKAVAGKVLDVLAQPYRLHGHDHYSTPSIGIVIFLAEQFSIEELLKKADLAMYQAKAAGRNNACFFDPTMQAAATIQAELERHLRLALANNDFVLHYRSQVNTAGEMMGVEAVLRWQHPTLGWISPATFMPMAEETGMIVPLGYWVLEAACAQLKAWESSPHTAAWILSVNVGAAQMAQPDVVTTMAQLLSRSGINPLRLRLELNETLLLRDIDSSMAKMKAIHALGVSFAIDHFGVGYSSVAYLQHLPLVQLKIDRSFVQDVLQDADHAVIARTIIAMGHGLGLQVMAEGVENAAQRDALASMGCDAFQGDVWFTEINPEMSADMSWDI